MYGGRYGTWMADERPEVKPTGQQDGDQGDRGHWFRGHILPRGH